MVSIDFGKKFSEKDRERIAERQFNKKILYKSMMGTGLHLIFTQNMNDETGK